MKKDKKKPVWAWNWNYKYWFAGLVQPAIVDALKMQGGMPLKAFFDNI